jgi:small subunit ribosomal protein S6
MRRYESVVILDPELAEDDIKNLTERFRRLVGEFGGEIIKIEDWGFRRLAYLVKRKERGRYVFFDYVGVPALLAEMERQFKITEQVMKYLSVKLDDDVDLEAFRAQSREQAAAAQAQAEAAEAAAAPVPPAPDTVTAEASVSTLAETVGNEEASAPDQGPLEAPVAETPEPPQAVASPEETPRAEIEPDQPGEAASPAETPTQPGGES